MTILLRFILLSILTFSSLNAEEGSYGKEGKIPVTAILDEYIEISTTVLNISWDLNALGIFDPITGSINSSESLFLSDINISTNIAQSYEITAESNFTLTNGKQTLHFVLIMESPNASSSSVSTNTTGVGSNNSTQALLTADYEGGEGALGKIQVTKAKLFVKFLEQDNVDIQAGTEEFTGSVTLVVLSK